MRFLEVLKVAKLIKYYGSDDWLGEVAADAGFYWLVHIYREEKNKRKIDPRLVCIPKWCTEIKHTEDLTT